MTIDLMLAGCRPQPLASYLKALGVFRVVAEQADPGATGRWEGGRFRLRSCLDGDDLVDFLVERYRPTPLVAPWNGGSGFGAKDATSSGSAVRAVEAIADSTLERLEPYRRTIAIIRQLVAAPDWEDLPKEAQVARCRNELPDEALAWLDSTVVLTSTGRAFPPLLGTGGNDGRFDFSANFMQRIGELCGLAARGRGAATPAQLAREALYAEEGVALETLAVGQFDPAGAGGPAAVPFGEAKAVTNPWDLVLLLEGALLFASGAARRLSGGSDRATVPFIVATSPAGHATAAIEESSRGELWAPLWTRPVGAAELAQLFGEGRAELGRHQAENGLSVARALACLGVDRGVSGFVRHAFVERNGRSMFAVPVGVYHAPSNADRDLGVLAQLDPWVERLRKSSNPPRSLALMLRQLDDAQFDAATRRSAPACQRVLVAAGRVDALQNRSPSLAERGLVRGLSAGRWCALLDDGTDEFRLAVSIASLRGRFAEARSWLRQLTVATEGSPRITGFGSRPIVEVAGELLARLAVAPPSPPARTGSAEVEQPASWLAGSTAIYAPIGGAVRFVNGLLDERRLGDLVAALSLLDWRERVSLPPQRPAPRPFCPPAYALLAPLFSSLPWPEPYHQHAAAARPDWPRRLLAGAIDGVCGEALRAYRIAGLEPSVRSPQAIARGVEAARIAAACVVPLSPSATTSMLNQVVVLDKTKEDSDAEPALA